MKLENSALVVVRIRFRYQVGNGKSQLSEKSADILVDQSKTIDPADLGVPDGANVQMVADVALLKSHTAPEVFQYESGNLFTAGYDLRQTKPFESELVRLPDWTNWSKNLVHQATSSEPSYFSPTNRSELQAVVLSAAKAGDVTLRTSGQRHSQPPLVVPNSARSAGRKKTWLVDLACYADLGTDGAQRIVKHPTEPNKVIANAGVREDEMDEWLLANNLMFKTVTAGGFFSLGGMTAVDVNGATVDQPIFAETVSEFTIMGADGRTTSVNSEQKPSSGFRPIDFARVSLGALGIVTSLTLDVQPRPSKTSLTARRESFRLDATKEAFVSKFQDLLANNDRVETFLVPYLDGNNQHEYLALLWNVENPPSSAAANTPQAVPNACECGKQEEFGAPYQPPFEEGAAEFLAVRAQAPGSPTEAKVIMDFAIARIKKMFDRAAASNSELWLSEAARVVFMSYFVELGTADEKGLGIAWDGLNAVTGKLGKSNPFNPVGPMEFRFMRGGHSALAGTYSKNGADSLFINLDFIGFTDIDNSTGRARLPQNLLDFFAEVEHDWVMLGGLPHNGKMYGFYDPDNPAAATQPFNPAFIRDIAQRRPDRVKAFNTYRESRDPEGLFSNGYVQSILGLDTE